MDNNMPKKPTDPWTLLIGLAIIAIGVIFLVQNFTAINLGNWWPLFLLIPAIAIAVQAYQIYQSNGKSVTAPVIGMATAASLILANALIFFLNFDYGKLWPIFIVIVGLGMIAGTLAAKR
jgi:uncharacterized membrane protein HdeD (DUF308 family)